MAIDFPSSPTVGTTLTVNGKTWYWSGTAWIAYTLLYVPSRITASVNPAVSGTTYIFAAGALTITLPSAPTTGNYIGFSNQSGTTTCVIDPNGKTINGTSGTMTIDVLNVSGTLLYESTVGWFLV